VAREEGGAESDCLLAMRTRVRAAGILTAFAVLCRQLAHRADLTISTIPDVRDEEEQNANWNQDHGQPKPRPKVGSIGERTRIALWTCAETNGQAEKTEADEQYCKNAKVISRAHGAF
jgi:hypothetical protein